jgi:hypothetical protein
MSPKKNTGTDYELLTKAIFESLLKQDEVETIELKHDVTFEGKSTTHQIDVYWSFRKGGITYHTVVQAKDWNTPVKQEQVLTFKGVVDDLKFRATGIMVTKTGYQKGAENYAQENSIGLFELREETEDKQGISIHLLMHIFIPGIEDAAMQIDSAWFSQEKLRLEISAADKIELVNGPQNELMFTDANGAALESVHALINRMLPLPLIGHDGERISHVFESPVFLKTTHPILNQMKLESFHFKLRVQERTEEIVLNPQRMVRFILKNVFEGTTQRFDANFNPIKE